MRFANNCSRALSARESAGLSRSNVASRKSAAPRRSSITSSASSVAAACRRSNMALCSSSSDVSGAAISGESSRSSTRAVSTRASNLFGSTVRRSRTVVRNDSIRRKPEIELTVDLSLASTSTSRPRWSLILDGTSPLTVARLSSAPGPLLRLPGSAPPVDPCSYPTWAVSSAGTRSSERRADTARNSVCERSEQEGGRRSTPLGRRGASGHGASRAAAH